MFVLVLLVIGRNRLVRQLKRIERERQFALEFGGKLTAYVESDGADENAYTWLMHRSPKMGAQLGVSIAYQRPFTRGPTVVVPVVNLVTEVRHFLNDRHDKELFGTARRVGEPIINNLLRHVGELDDERDKVREEFSNPLAWAREGVSVLLGIPLRVAVTLRLLSPGRARKWDKSPLQTIVSGAVTLVTVTGALAETITGWPAITRVAGSVLSVVAGTDQPPSDAAQTTLPPPASETRTPEPSVTSSPATPTATVGTLR